MRAMCVSVLSICVRWLEASFRRVGMGAMIGSQLQRGENVCAMSLQRCAWTKCKAKQVLGCDSLLCLMGYSLCMMDRWRFVDSVARMARVLVCVEEKLSHRRSLLGRVLRSLRYLRLM